MNPEDFHDEQSNECWDCGGSGVYDESCQCEAFEDICFCAEPEPRTCSTCKGEGFLK